MKLFFVTIFGLLVSSTGFAQKGTYYVGGQAGFSSSTSKFESTELGKSNSWSISPEVGTFLTDNIQLGVAFNVVGATNETPNQYKETQNYFGGTLYSRYFFGEGSKAFRPFIGLNLSALPGTREIVEYNLLTTTKTEWDMFSFGANLNAGFAYALSPKVTVVGSLGFLGFESTTQERKGVEGKYTRNTFGFDLNSLGNRFNIGLYLTL